MEPGITERVSYAVVDVNSDGYVDLTFSGPQPVTYWGGPRGFTADNKTVISTRYSFYGTFADFNRDGWLDYVCSEFYPGSTESEALFRQPNRFRAVQPIYVSHQWAARVNRGRSESGWLARRDFRNHV